MRNDILVFVLGLALIVTLDLEPDGTDEEGQAAQGTPPAVLASEPESPPESHGPVGMWGPDSVATLDQIASDVTDSALSNPLWN